jgi:hypothetical protein
MALNVAKISEFNPNLIKFSEVRKNARGGKMVYLNNTDGSKILLKLPPLKAPFGVSSFTEENGKVSSYSLPLSCDNAEVAVKFAQLDDNICNFVKDHSEELLGKKLGLEVIREMYKSPFKPSTKEGYAPLLNLKVIMDPVTGDIKTEFYDSKGTDIPIEQLEREKGQIMTTLIEVAQIWRTPAGFGVSVRVRQAKVAASNKIPARALLDDDEQTIGDEEEPQEEFDE